MCMARGGPRPGAGRPKGTGKYREETVVIRLPKSRAAALQHSLRNPLPPLYEFETAAGFPIQGTENEERRLDLNEWLVEKPEATFFVKVRGDSMIGAGINSGDVVIVNRSAFPRDGDIVIACVEGGLTIKRLRISGKSACLEAANPDYPPILIENPHSLKIWGVVTCCIHHV